MRFNALISGLFICFDIQMCVKLPPTRCLLARTQGVRTNPGCSWACICFPIGVGFLRPWFLATCLWPEFSGLAFTYFGSSSMTLQFSFISLSWHKISLSPFGVGLCLFGLHDMRIICFDVERDLLPHTLGRLKAGWENIWLSWFVCFSFGDFSRSIHRPARFALGHILMGLRQLGWEWGKGFNFCLTSC